LERPPLDLAVLQPALRVVLERRDDGRIGAELLPGSVVVLDESIIDPFLSGSLRLERLDNALAVGAGDPCAVREGVLLRTLRKILVEVSDVPGRGSSHDAGSLPSCPQSVLFSLPS